MAEQTPKIFAEGMSYTPKDIPKAPWIKGQIGVKVDKFIKFAQQHVDERGWVNIDIKEGREGNMYLELNNFRKTLEKPNFIKEEEEEIAF